MSDPDRPRVVMLGSYVPRKCGIATFTNDLASAVALRAFEKPLGQAGGVRIVAMNDHEDTYAYGPEVVFEVGQHRKKDYWTAAEEINNGRVDVVNVQHEYGLFGGECGDYLFELLDRLRRPVISTLHTILGHPSPRQRHVLCRLCDRSSAVVVMARRARQLLQDIYDVPERKIRLIYHGVPDVPFGDTEPFKERFGLSGRPIILTFGLLSPGKGIEVMIEAMARVVPDYPDAVYVVLGVTHPNIRHEQGEAYRIGLEHKIVELGLEKNVFFHNRYVSREDLCEYLQAADIFVTPYPGMEQITSGTLTYALAVGNAIVSTPYRYAEELLADGRGLLAPYGDINAWASALKRLIGDVPLRQAMRQAAYEHGRKMIWPQVAQEYVDLYDGARRDYAASRTREVAPAARSVTISLPEVRMDHLFTMTDQTGLIQHATYNIPNRAHGYCTDDNTRALVVSTMWWSLFKEEKALPLIAAYLSFIQYSQPSEGARFRNFMTYDRRWLDGDGGDDCQGRVMWALGHLIAHAPDDPTRNMARYLFSGVLEGARRFQSPRAWALAVLGLHYSLRVYPEGGAGDMFAHFGRRLNEAFRSNESDDWHWLEDTVTYDNGRMPQALIIAGYQLDDADMSARGLRVLDWLLRNQTSPSGRLSVIGCHGWFSRGGRKAQYDQQPIEPAALIGACKAAYHVTGERRWLKEMRKCFEWYLGYNDDGLSLLNFKTRGCHDGLLQGSVNANQGAEALVSWLLSLLIMHEMQSGNVENLA